MTEHPPGWHPDPRGRHEQRYWDGTRWTDHVADGDVTGRDPVDRVDERAAPAVVPDTAAGAVAVPIPTPVPQPEPAPTSEGGPEAALEAVSDAVDRAVGHKPASLAALLTVAAPGMGHVYLSVRRPTAYLLLAGTLAAIVLSCFVSFPIALVVYLAALAFALTDLRGELAPVRQRGGLAMFSDLGPRLAWPLVIAGGALLVLSLLLPWYRQAVGGVAVSISAFDALSLIDLILLVIGAGSAVLGVLNLAQGAERRPVAGQVARIVAAAGALALLLVLFRMLIVPDGGLELGIERSFGVLLAFAASVLLAGGAAGAAASKR